MNGDERITKIALTYLNQMHAGEIPWNDQFYEKMANIAAIFSHKMEKEDT